MNAVLLGSVRLAMAQSGYNPETPWNTMEANQFIESHLHDPSKHDAVLYSIVA